jgi:hypothetical protein
MSDRYGRDVLSNDPHRRPVRAPRTVPADVGLVVECASSGYCGAIIRVEKTASGLAAELEDRAGSRRLFPMVAGAFLLEGEPVTLVRAQPDSDASTGRAPAPRRSTSGSRYVEGARAQVARASRIWVEGTHDAELVEKIWGHDLRIAAIVVEPLHGADNLLAALREFSPGRDRRVGIMLDHLVPGSKETRLAVEARAAFAPNVEVVGHPYVDVWQAIRPQAVGIEEWPEVPPGQPWKAGVVAGLGWDLTEQQAWSRILARVNDYTDLEPAILSRVEYLIDFVTASG